MEELDILLAAHAHASTRGVAQIRRRSRAQRIWRGVRAWVACWVIAGGSLLLPVRVVTFTLFFMAGPIAAANAWTEKAQVVRVHGTCPHCGDSRDRAVHQAARMVIPIACEACGREILLSPGARVLGLPDDD